MGLRGNLKTLTGPKSEHRSGLGDLPAGVGCHAEIHSWCGITSIHAFDAAATVHAHLEAMVTGVRTNELRYVRTSGLLS